jgi:hypothetical protein
MRRLDCNERVTIEKSCVEKDLGVCVDKELKYSWHIGMQVNTSNRLLCLIRRSYEYLDIEMMKLLFTSFVCPNLEFGNVVLSPTLENDKNLVESVQSRATKISPG